MTVGFQLRPIFRNEFFNSGNIDQVQNEVQFVVTPRIGFAGGMVVRKAFNPMLSIETGINYIRRNYNLIVTDLDSSFSETNIFSIVQYEIPFSALLYVRVADKIYMNNSAGISLNMFKRSEVEQGVDIVYEFQRSVWIIPGLIANVGFDYRTDNLGMFYFGASYQLPFDDIITITVDYFASNYVETYSTKLGLSFFTFDVKYFFPIKGNE